MSSSAIPDGWMGLDIGPDSIKTFNDALDTTKTIIWNGPMGVFEFDKFATGTEVRKKSHIQCLSLKMFAVIISPLYGNACPPNYAVGFMHHRHLRLKTCLGV